MAVLAQDLSLSTQVLLWQHLQQRLQLAPVYEVR